MSIVESPALRIAVEQIASIAAEVRLQLAPGLSVLEAVSFEPLLAGAEIGMAGAELMTRARGHGGLAKSTFAVTTCDLSLSEAWIWLNSEAWSEYFDRTPRTRATVAHELGHVTLHHAEFVELGLIDAEPDHDEQLDREAWRFAAHLLIPDQALRRLPRLRADEVARRFGVTAMLAGRRIEEFEKVR